MTSATRKVAAVPAAGSPPRLLFIDALRGFDMFWITGGDILARALAVWLGWHWLDHQMEHLPWEGFVFYDLIFPLFIFIVGIVLPMSLERYRANPSAAYPRILRRFVLLLVLGWINWGLLQFDFAEMRWPGVLQRIAICYLFTALAVLHLRDARAGDPGGVTAARLLGAARLRAGAGLPGLRPVARGQPRRATSIAWSCPASSAAIRSATTKACCRTFPPSPRACSAR